ncbi:MAG TPA: hypothetical protein VI322_05790 [Candidatus Saccharimonadia bacterium]
MPTFRFNKLVRDKIVDQQLATGAKPAYRSLGPDDHKLALIDKLIEEATEEEATEVKRAAAHEIIAEIADLQQVVDDLRSVCQVTAEQVAEAQAVKNDKAGAFMKGLYVESVEVADDSRWTQYYRDNADRYPEVTNL